jgi:hypothetical protein
MEQNLEGKDKEWIETSQCQIRICRSMHRGRTSCHASMQTKQNSRGATEGAENRRRI